MYRVFRLEGKDGIGPYQNRSTQEQAYLADDHCSDYTTHPSAGIDFGWNEVTSAHLFACDSLDSLIRWFGDHIDGLLDIGFDIVVYDVPTMKYGMSGLQVIFDRTRAVKVDA